MATALSRAPLRIGLAIAAATTVIDQAVKTSLLYGFGLTEHSRVAVAPFVDLVLTWNTGISYGLFRQSGPVAQEMLVVFKLAAVALLMVWLARTRSRLVGASLGLIVGGAVGNLIDRALHGAVMDFVLLHFTTASFTFQWYVFNLADAGIVAGVAALIYESAFLQGAAKVP
ncbi:MAG: signal peptidase II [Bradyrhizobiaceae bacterium]|nr:signal peptidase II [Bradyrhizobiaceae bacterium]